MKMIQLILHIEMKAALSDNCRKHTKTLCGVNTPSLKFKASGTNSYRCALKTLLTFGALTVIFPAT
jgi:hypothetical protein